MTSGLKAQFKAAQLSPQHWQSGNEPRIQASPTKTPLPPKAQLSEALYFAEKDESGFTPQRIYLDSFDLLLIL